MFPPVRVAPAVTAAPPPIKEDASEEAQFSKPSPSPSRPTPTPTPRAAAAALVVWLLPLPLAIDLEPVAGELPGDDEPL